MVDPNNQEGSLPEDDFSGASDSLTVLHVGDVFLDGPVGHLRRDTKEHRREELRDAFEAFLKCVDEEKADAVIFSGNLLDGRYAGDDTLTFLIHAFEKRPSCHFVIAPGPFDACDEESVYRSRRLPRNVHIFFEEVLGTYSFPELPLTVYGWGYRAATCNHAPLIGAHKTSGDRFAILCGYTCLNAADSANAPADEAALAAFGAHYVALSGGIHDGFHCAGDGIYAYSGSFEGRDGGKTTVQSGGYIRVKATRSMGGWAIDTRRISLDTYTYVTERIDVSHLFTAEAVCERLKARVREHEYGAKTVLRVILYGSVPLCASFEGVDGVDYGVYSLWVEDRTVPTDDGTLLLREMTARGELYRHFYPKMMEGSEEDRARAARAFRIGYAALSGEDFAKY